MKDLGARVAVAAVGIPAVLALLYKGGWILGVPIALLAALGAGEVNRFAECRGVHPFSWLSMPAAAAVVAAAVVLPDFASFAPWVLAGLGGLTMVTLVTALVARRPGDAPLGSVSATLFGAVYAGLPMACIVLLQALPERLGWTAIRPSPWAGLMIVALPLASTWVGDAAALFAGTAWGKRKLFPTVSPNKSWVGAWAGVTSASAAGALWLAVARDHLPGLPIEDFGAAAGVGACLGLGAIVGDLAESLLKREAGVKDSGHIFPGHGGVMDRLDALTFTIPMAYAILCALEWLA